MPDTTLEEYYFAQKQHEQQKADEGVTEGYDIEAGLPELGFAADIDVSGMARDVAMQSLGGIRDAVEELGQSLYWMSQEFDLASLEDPFTVLDEVVKEDPNLMKLSAIGVPEVEHSDSTVANLSRGIFQFVTGFILMTALTGPMGRTVGGTKSFMSVAAKYPRVLKVLGTLAEGAAAGALTDALIFDPDDPRLANLIDQLAPELKNPITDYLKADPNDTEALKRFKAAAEGTVIGTAFNMLLPIVKGMRHVKLANMGYKPGTTFRKVTPEEFINARSQSKRISYLSNTPAEDLAKHDLYLNEFGSVGYAMSPDKDLQMLFNNSQTPGLGAVAVEHGIRKGGKTLDCFDGFLPEYYTRFGFKEYDRIDWDDAYAPPDWNYGKDGRPDVVFMSLEDQPFSTINYMRKKAGDTVEKAGPYIEQARKLLSDEGGYVYRVSLHR